MGKSRHRKLQSYSVADLRKELKKHNASCSGKKHELVTRLKGILNGSYIINSEDETISDVLDITSGNLEVQRESCDPNDKHVITERLEILEQNYKYLMNQKTKIARALVRKDAEIADLKERLTQLEAIHVNSNNKLSNFNNKIPRRRSSINSNVSHETTANSQCNASDNTNNVKSSKLLILGDSRAKNLSAAFLGKTTNELYNICSITKPNATLDDIIADAEKLTENFAEQDFLIVFGGSENAVKGTRVKNQSLDTLKRLSKRIKVIFISIPYCGNRVILNKLIYDVNSMIYHALDAELDNIFYVDINCILSVNELTTSGSYLKHSGKVKLVHYLSSIIFRSESTVGRSSFVNINNLIYPAVTDSADDNFKATHDLMGREEAQVPNTAQKKNMNMREDNDRLYPTLPANDNQLF